MPYVNFTVVVLLAAFIDSLGLSTYFAFSAIDDASSQRSLATGDILEFA